MNNLDLKSTAEDLIDTFLKAGKIAKEISQKGVKIVIKADKSPVTNGDLAVDKLLQTKIKSVTPNIPIISEETVNFNIKGDDFDLLAQTAIVHAQFELLHPFKDGNGRIGRLLIPLFLFSKKRLSSPMFYLSDYLETNRQEYYERLGAISQEGDWTGWIEFFLKAVIHQSNSNLKKVKQIMKLYEDTKEQIRVLTHSQYTTQLLDGIFDRPIFKASDFSTRFGIQKPTLHGLLRTLTTEEGPLVLLKEGLGRRASIYAFPQLLNICEGKEVFPVTNN